MVTLSGNNLVMSWSDDDCRAALRAAVTGRHGAPLRIVDYRVWRAGQVTEWPSDAVIVDHLGSWADAVRPFGGATTPILDREEIQSRSRPSVDLDLTGVGRRDGGTRPLGGRRRSSVPRAVVRGGRQ